jgi:hypothetical protein
MRRPVRPTLILTMTAAAVAASLVAAAPAGASGRQEIHIQDRCDPASFTAAGIPCVATGRGTVTFPELLATLTPEIGGHGAWRFTRTDTHIDRGEALHITDTGGETHSFTEVDVFGRTFLDLPTNNALPPGTPVVSPIGDLRFLAAGGSVDVTGLSRGTHLFQCLIHPWMRTTVEVR